MKLDFEEINRAALANFDTVVARFVPGGTRQGAEYVTRNPTRADSNPGSFKINCNSAVWCDFATGEKGKDLISLIAYVEPCKQGEAAHHLAVFLGIETPTTNKRTATAPAPRVVETFIFHNADGSEAYRKDRYEPGFNPGESKGFAFYRMINGKREKGGGGIHLPYRLHAVLAAETVLFFEGEAKSGYCV